MYGKDHGGNRCFSVLLSIYWKENPAWFREALDSIFYQTLLPNEIVLVEDGPLTEELYSIIDEYEKKYPVFTRIRNEQNIGLGLSLQRGLLACKNEAIARMDSDDIIPNDRFEKQLSMFDKGYDVISCWSLLFENNIDNVVAIKKRPELHPDIVKLAHKRSPVCHAGCLLRKSAVLNAGNYINCSLYEDYHLWVRMILSGAQFYNIQEVLYYVRTSREQVDRRSGWNYFFTEIGVFKEFYRMGFYNIFDVIYNSGIRFVVRLAPSSIRTCIIKKIWNHKSY